MCLINFSFQQHPDYPFLLAGNRDEFYARPTAPLHWWEDEPNVLAGRDLKDGGTWMGINKAGKFAALTNYRDLNNIRNDAPSRGIIAQQFLNGALPLEEMHRFLKTRGRRFNGFNLIYGDQDELYYYSNVNDTVRQLHPGIYGLSNALLDTPWPKVINSKSAFTRLTENTVNPDQIIEMLHNTDTVADDQLPHTGVEPEWEKRLSAMFITSPEYGTRLTTFVSIRAGGHVIYREKGYRPAHDITFEFSLQP